MDENITAFFDNRGVFNKKYVEQLICFLRDQTPKKTFGQVGEFFEIKNHPGSYISVCKAGKANVTKGHMQAFARFMHTDVDSLLDQFATTIQEGSGSCVMNDDNAEEPPSSAEQPDESSADGDHDASLFVPQHMHDKFLFDLQKILGIRVDADCLAVLNENPVDATRSNLKMFRETGQVPKPWMTLIIQKNAQEILTECYAPVKVDEKQQASEPSPSSCSNEKRQSHLHPVQCTSLQDVPAPFVNAFFDALYRAGKAARINCALPTFVGALALHLPECTVSVKSANELSPSVIISIHNGKIAAEFHFDPVAVFS